MFKYLKNEILNAVDAVKAGNEYRAEKFGHESPDSERLVALRKSQKNERQYQPNKLKNIDDINAFKNEFAYWDEWTGSRYVRRLNPNPKRIKRGLEVPRKGTCRSNAVTGEWEPR